MHVLSKVRVPFTILLLLIATLVTIIQMASPTRAATSDTSTVQVVNADGGVYWRSKPDWNMAIQVTGHGVYTGDTVYLVCYKRGGTVPPYYNNPLWYWARVITGQGQGEGWVNDHFLATGSDQPNIPVSDVPTCTTQLNGGNWGGYVAAGKQFTDVKATWTIPAVSCGFFENSNSYIWVGLGGMNAPLAQIGTLSDCSQGQAQYGAWWEMVGVPYKSNAQPITNLSPGTLVTAEVQYKGGGIYHLSITANGTLVFSQDKNGSMDAGASNTADFIVEKPGSPLSHFDPITLTDISADGQSIEAAPQEIIVTVDNPEAELISPLTNGDSFTVTWIHS